MASRFVVPFAAGRGLGTFEPLFDLHREMNRLFDDAFRGSATGGSGGGGQQGIVAPRLDVREDEQELCITADMPGVDPANIDLRIEGDMLTMSGERQDRQERQQQNFHVMERSYGRFQRSLQLPFSPDPGQVSARFENGVLEMHVPKQGAQERSHRIPLQGGSQRSAQIGTQGPSGGSERSSANGDDMPTSPTSREGDGSSGGAASSSH